MADDGFDTDVLVVGAGPMGAATALSLATLGVRVRMVSMYGWVAPTPRAHITNQRAMEVLRDLGVENEVKKHATPWEQMGSGPVMTSMAGREIARMPGWHLASDRRGEAMAASPCTYLDVVQPFMEPVLVGAAAARGAKVRFDTEFLRFEQDADGVTSWVLDRLTGVEYSIRSRYLVGADGGRSRIVEQLGLPLEGQMALAGSQYVLIRADLSRYMVHRPSILNFVVTPMPDGSVAFGALRAIKPWTEWICGWGFDVNAGEPDSSPEVLLPKIRALLGDDEVEIEILNVSSWYVNQVFATHYSSGRVLCGGDAVHRHPPNNGLGSNTCIQDAQNLAWKLAYVLRGDAGEALLDTYSDERQPVGEQVVGRANLSRAEFAPLREALVATGDGTPIENVVANLEAPTPEGAELRERFVQALHLRNYEYNAAGGEMNQRYVSAAVLPDDAPPEEFTRDRLLYLQATTRPGAKLPHAWLVNKHGHRISTLDLVGRGAFTVVTGLAGVAWERAVQSIDRPYLRSAVIGRVDTLDAMSEWHRLREIHEAGALLVRPDGYVAWRHLDPVWDDDTARDLLTAALDAVLARN